MKNLLPLLAALALPPLAAGAQTAPAPRPLNLRDLAQLRDVADPNLSPDGAWVAYTVARVDTATDKRDADIWMARTDGSQNLRITTNPASESKPRFSPDGKYLSFVSSRGEDDGGNAQLWLLNRAGGEAEKVTKLKGSVSDYVWSPDGQRIAMILKDADPDSLTAAQKAKKKTAPPIVIDRFQFKKDVDGYLNQQRQHLYVFDVATRRLVCLTPGPYDEHLPAWSPDGKQLAFSSKRGPDPDRHDNYDLFLIDAKAGAPARPLLATDVPESAPGYGSRPVWSPDGRRIAFVQGGPKEQLVYALHQLMVVDVAGGPARALTAGLDRNTTQPEWAPDGKSLYFLLEDDRAESLMRVPATGGKPEKVLAGPRQVGDFAMAAKGQLVVLSSQPQQPTEVFALDKKGALRPLSKQNDAWLKGVTLGAVEPIQAKSKDGTLVSGFTIKPVGYQAGRKYPAILRIHGGPVAQFGYGFSFEWQYFAANGYAVVVANPRGSSGRGLEYSKAIFADWGNKDTDDVLAVVDYAVAQGLADPERLGVGGWSYGGIMTDQVIARDQRFKAAVSGASIGNVLAGYGTDQYIRDYETELGTPWKNTDVYLRVSYPFYHADQIKTPTLFVCGEKDFNVPLLNTEQMYQALKSLNVPTQLIIYPGQFHGVSTPSYVKDRYVRYLGWYNKYLMPKGPAAAGAQGGE
ncbi:S9 family peptidase [Hymenobacter caeli]|uniref:Dipeptidyl aminopeptidase/acylaminoacyl peptidase n=1 Tax=Hymenobacter caeli TaxID=2735894 RepID=A0ABX2FMH3_9BACT|nr:S9 family peptidase [Hymenobacter caeli]NRT17675.1 dipeptidyl aminopeptidase/acylaminoacyl peptidase [Hymenobacter caeli]